MALGYLCWRREKTRNNVVGNEYFDDVSGFSFESLRKIGYCLVYQAICQDQVCFVPHHTLVVEDHANNATALINN